MYDVNRLYPIFQSILGNGKLYSHNEYYFHCPFCNHTKPKLAINLGKGKWHCWTCESSGGTLISLLKRLNVSPSQITELKEILSEEIKYYPTDKHVAFIQLPVEFKPLWISSKSIEYKNAIQYLKNRNISDRDIIRYGMGYCETGNYSNRIIIPSYDEFGKLNYFVGRDYYNTSSMKYKNPPLSKNIIGFEYHINWSYPIVLCEGVMDAIAIKWNAIPLFGKSLPSKLQQKIIQNKVKDIYIALDTDATKSIIQMANKFLKEGQNIRIVELNDKDPSIIGFSKMQELIQHSAITSFYDIISMKLSL